MSKRRYIIIVEGAFRFEEEVSPQRMSNFRRLSASNVLDKGSFLAEIGQNVSFDAERVHIEAVTNGGELDEVCATVMDTDIIAEATK